LEANKANQKNFGSKTKRKYALLIFAFVGSKKFKAKRSENFFFQVSVRNGPRFALKGKFFLAKPAHPGANPVQDRKIMLYHSVI
jgi:hypothetical protein